MDNTGSIPQSVMSYNCIDPIVYDGHGINTVQSWDVCGVNHAYHDPTIGYAGCTNFEPGTPTPSPTPFNGALGLGRSQLCPGGEPYRLAGSAPLRRRPHRPGARRLPDPWVTRCMVQPAGEIHRIWGDVDCSAAVNAVDGLKLLRYDAGLSVVYVDPECPDIGDELPTVGGATSTPTPTPTPVPSGGTPSGTSSPTATPTPTPTPTPHVSGTPGPTASPTPAPTFGPPSNDCDYLDPPIPIPDNNPDTGATLGVEFNDNRTIVDLQVCVNINHTWVGDLGIGIGHVETGTIAVLKAGNPLCSSDNVRVLFSDAAPTLADNVCNVSSPAINGTFKPTQPLSVFDGESLDGTWLILVLDLAAGDTGHVLGGVIYAQLANNSARAGEALSTSASNDLAGLIQRATIEASGRSAVR